MRLDDYRNSDNVSDQRGQSFGGGGGFGGGGSGGSGGPGDSFSSGGGNASVDPWNQAPPAGGLSDEPPF